MALMMGLSTASCGLGGDNSSSGSGEQPAVTTGNWNERPSVQRGDVATLSKQVARDKLLGMWVGNAIGIGSGYEYCRTNDKNYDSNPMDAIVVPGDKTYVALADKYWEPNGQICSGSIGVNKLRTHPISDARIMKGLVISDDDMHVDVLNQFIFRDNGANLGAEDVAAAWDKYEVSDVGGGSSVTPNVRNNGYMPPYTGQRMYGNTGYWVTEAWIENETLGGIFPYMYQSVEAYNEIFATHTGDALCSYLGKLCALMYSLAYEYNDPLVILEKAFDRMDKTSEIYEIYQFVLQCKADGMTWRETCLEVAKKRVNVQAHKGGSASDFSINANAGMIFIGLIYGNGDFEESVKITSLCGLDGDCTAATVAGLLGLMKGFDALPQKYKNYINGDSIYFNYTGKNGEEIGISWGGAFAYCGKNFPNALTFNQLTDITLNNLEAQVLARGGEKEGDNYYIYKQSLAPISQVAVVDKSFEQENVSGAWKSEGSEGYSFIVQGKAHLGDKAGMLTTATITDSAKAYQELALVKGNRYRVSVWVTGCSDREIRVFAGDKYRSFYNPITKANEFSKYELYFTAESDIEKIGIELCASTEDRSYSMDVVFDDMSVEDVTHLTDKYYQEFGLNQFYVANPDCVGDNSVRLECMEGLRFDFQGMQGYQTFKVYYKNANYDMAVAQLMIDGKVCGTIPLPAQGDGVDFNEGNCAIVYMHAGSGTHEFKMVLQSFDGVEIQRVEVYGGNPVFEK